MHADLPIETLIRSIASLDRAGCKQELRSFQRLDFTDDFLESLSDDRLRHVLMAACLQARKTAHLRKRA